MFRLAKTKKEVNYLRDKAVEAGGQVTKDLPHNVRVNDPVSHKLMLSALKVKGGFALVLPDVFWSEK